jgi:hypothetical protein
MVAVTVVEVVKNTTFIRLKEPTRLAKTAKEEAKQWSHDVSSMLNPKIRVFNLTFGKLQFSPCSSNCF